MVDYLDLGSEIDYPTYNAIVYLLRKFKRLSSDLTLGKSVITTDYGTLSFTGGLTSLGGNFIIESPVTVSANDCLRNCFYSLHFTVIDRNLSGTVNRRVATVTGNTGETGDLEITIPTTFLDSDEVILPDFKLDIVFDEHEYYTPLNVIQTEISLDKPAITQGEVLTITGTVTDKAEGNPVVGVPVKVWVNDTPYIRTTDSNGKVTVEYTCGNTQRISTVKIMEAQTTFYEEYMAMTWKEPTLTIKSLTSDGEVLIDWGDGTTETQNGTFRLTHNYTDNQTYHTIIISGKITSMGERCFMGQGGLKSIHIPSSISSLEPYCFIQCINLTDVFIPSSVTTIGSYCFYGCRGLPSISIHDGVTSIGSACFGSCIALVDYQLYWEDSDDIIEYSSSKMPNNTNTVFTIPYGTTSKYTAKNYPSAKLVERSPEPDTITLTADHDIIQSTETATLTATVTDNNTPVSGVSVTFYKEDTIMETKTTDSNGEASITYTGTGAGEIEFRAKVSTLLQETYELYDCLLYDSATSEDTTKWTNQGVTATYSDNGTNIIGATDYRYASKYSLTDDLIIEFDMFVPSTVSTNPSLFLRGTSTQLGSSLYPRGQWNHIKIEFTHLHLKITCGNNVTVNQDISTSTSVFQFRVNNSELSFKNFKIYPI